MFTPIHGGCPVDMVLRSQFDHVLFRWPCSEKPEHQGDHEYRAETGELLAWHIQLPEVTEATMRLYASAHT